LRQRRAGLGLPPRPRGPPLIDPATRGRDRAGGAPPHLRRGPGPRARAAGDKRSSPAPLRGPRARRGASGGGERTDAARPGNNQQPVVDEVPEPAVKGPLDVIVKIGGAGVCRTDLHIIEGQWAERTQTVLPYTLGHENAGWVHEVGPGVTNVAVGDTVILHPAPSCGLCGPRRGGDDLHCENGAFPGLVNRDGGMADFLLTTARACVKLDPQTQPADVAALADAGITAYHAVRKAIPLLYPGTTCVVIGAGGLGHIGIQC